MDHLHEQIAQLAAGMMRARGDDLAGIQHLDATPLPDKRAIHAMLDKLLELLFPGYYGGGVPFAHLDLRIQMLAAEVAETLRQQTFREAQHLCRRAQPDCAECHRYADEVAGTMLAELPQVRRTLDEDACAAYRNDPAASGYDEIFFSYPGMEAVAVHRLAHVLNRQGLVLLPRIMSEWAHMRTGIDIHPGAAIGAGFFIDHGTGVVIGETTTIGEHVTLYQGVTLGALNFPRDGQGNVIRGAKRHPTIEDEVVIYAGATILGGETVIGRGAVIGGNVWLTESVPPGSRVVIGKPDLRIIQRKDAPPAPLLAAAAGAHAQEPPRRLPPCAVDGKTRCER